MRSVRLQVDAAIAARRLARWAAAGAVLRRRITAGEVAAASLLTPQNATPAALGILRGWSEARGAPPVEVYAVGAALTGVAVIAFAGAEWLRRAASRVEAG